MQAFVVVGPESSGNRFMVRLLVASGCQDNDTKDKLAFHRSFPHGKNWPDLNTIIKDLRTANYNPKLLIMVREGYANGLSQISQNHVRNIQDAEKHYKDAYRSIFRSVVEMDADFLVVPYSSLGRRRFLEWLFGQLKLTVPDEKIFVDADNKYHPESLSTFKKGPHLSGMVPAHLILDITSLSSPKS
jgi:hypothetical protein